MHLQTCLKKDLTKIQETEIGRVLKNFGREGKIPTKPSIKFTMESEEDSKLPFLDYLLKRENDGVLTSTIYGKATHTDRYLHCTFHHLFMLREN